MGLFNVNRTNSEILASRRPSETLQNRDVFETQQMERSTLGKPQTPTSRIVLTVIAGVLIAILAWLLASFYQFFVDGGLRAGLSGNFANPSAFGFSDYTGFTFGKFLFTVGVTGGSCAILYAVLMRNLDVQNRLHDAKDINQYENDQHIALPDELQKKFDWFPDVGATSDVQFSSMISHMALSNKGIKLVPVAQRAKSDIVDEDGEIILYKGEVLRDDDGNVLYDKDRLIDTKFMDALFDASGLPKGKGSDNFRVFYDATKIPYNPGNKDRDKLKGSKEKPLNTVADLINRDWQLPYYEPQRPGGAYLVDTAPVNTMVLAITRAGKGQTVIEPTLDMWTRERRPNNMVINDPKGELLVKFYVRATVRGFQIVQFKLHNAMKTDIYNRASRFVMKSYNII